MRVHIDNQVYEVMEDFYDRSMDVHPTLDEVTVINKTLRLEQAMYDFAEHAEIFHKVPYRRDWQEKGYHEFVYEDFHFAYRVYQTSEGEKVVQFHDACHSLLNYNPEDAIDSEE